MAISDADLALRLSTWRLGDPDCSPWPIWGELNAAQRRFAMAEVDRHLFAMKRKTMRAWLDGPPTDEPPPFPDVARLVWEGAPENVAPGSPAALLGDDGPQDTPPSA